jgi:ABC-2 type transport system permease protein
VNPNIFVSYVGWKTGNIKPSITSLLRMTQGVGRSIMLHLLKMDLYRMFRSRALWVTLIITVFISIAVIGILSFEFKTIQQSDVLIPETQINDTFEGNHIDQAGSANSSNEQTEGVIATQSDQPNLGISISMDSTAAMYSINQDGELTFKVSMGAIYDSLFTSKIFILICGIYTALFINAERKNGFIKNIAGQFSSRTPLILAKLVAIAVSTFIIYTASILSILLASMLFFKRDLVFTNVSGVLTMMILQFYLHYVFCLVILLLGTITDSLLPSLMSAILIGNGVSLLLTQAFNLLLDKVVGLREPNAAHYLLTQQVIEAQSQATSSVITWALGIGAIYAVCSIVLSMTAIRRRDVC